MIVAGEVREQEAPVALDPDEAWLAAAVGDVGALGGQILAVRVGRGDEEGVGTLD